MPGQACSVCWAGPGWPLPQERYRARCGACWVCGSGGCTTTPSRQGPLQRLGQGRPPSGPQARPNGVRSLAFCDGSNTGLTQSTLQGLARLLVGGLRLGPTLRCSRVPSRSCGPHWGGRRLWPAPAPGRGLRSWTRNHPARCPGPGTAVCSLPCRTAAPPSPPQSPGIRPARHEQPTRPLTQTGAPKGTAPWRPSGCAPG